LLSFDTSPENDVALAVQGYKLSLGLDAAILAIQLHLVHARIHSHDAMVAELLAARLSSSALHILDSWSCSGSALVRVNDRNLCVQQVGKDVGLERHCRAKRVVTVHHKKQDRVVVRQVGHCEGACAGVANLEFKFVSSFQRREEIFASLVRHSTVIRELLFGAEHIQSCRIRIGVADAKTVLELQSLHEAVSQARRPKRVSLGAALRLHECARERYGSQGC